MNQYKSYNENDNAPLPKLKVIGSFQPSTAFSVLPRYNTDESVTFRVSMWIPSLIWFGLGLGIPISMAIDYHFHPKNYINPPVIFSVAGGVSMILLICGLYTLRLWRSLRIETNGTVHFDIPKAVGRNQFTLVNGNVWVDEVTRIRNGKKGVHLSLFKFISNKLKNANPLLTGTPALVVHDKSICFLLVHNQIEQIAQYQDMLEHSYNLSASGGRYTINFSGLCDEGWA